MNPKVKNQLTIAYLQTLFPVDFPEGRINISPLSDNLELREYCKSKNIEQWALITPMNPGSRTLSAEENLSRLRAFEQELSGFRTHLSVSKPERDSPDIVDEAMPETGYFIENLYPWEAAKLGYKWGQNAILIGTDSGYASLLWTTEGESVVVCKISFHRSHPISSDGIHLIS